MADLTSTLLAAGQADRAAEARLQEWQTANFGELATALSVEIATEGKPLPARQMAALYLKNCLSAKSAATQKDKHDRWKAVDASTRTSIKESLLAALRSPSAQVPHFAAVVAAEIASVELPFGEWPNFVAALTDNLQSATPLPEAVQLASLEAVGYTCERIVEVEEMLEVPELPAQTVDKMLTTITSSGTPDRSPKLRLASLQALKNSLAFVRKNMETKTERDFIINNAICEPVLSPDPQLRRLAFSCLDNVAEFYYEHLQDYMTNIFQLTTEAIQKDVDETVKMAAMEFWSTVGMMEQSYLDEETALREDNLPLTRPPCKRYVQTAMSTLVPLLLENLSRQDDDYEEEDAWNLRAASAICLETVSQTVEDLIVPVVMPFVQQHIASDDWRLRDAAIIAFASIMDGPSTEVLGEYVNQSINVLLQTFNDASEIVRDSATHCISTICKMHIAAVQPAQVHTILQGLIEKVRENPRIAAHACSAIFNIGQSMKPPNQEPEETNLLSAPMFPLLKALLDATDREDAGEANLRVAAMSAACEVVNAAALDVKTILEQMLPTILARMESTVKLEVVSNEDRETMAQVLGLQCGLLSSLVQRLEKQDLDPLADRAVTVVLQVLQVPHAQCHEEAFLVLGAIATVMDEDFAKYLEALKPFLVSGLRSFQARSLCNACLGVVVDLCGAVGAQIQPLCDPIMSALMECLKDSTASREIKPVVISAFGDIALAIGAGYEPYMQLTTMFLMQAANQQAPADNEDMVAFINSLRVAILEAYSGILIGLTDGNALPLFSPNVQSVLTFLQFLSLPESNRDDEVLQRAVMLIGDMCQRLGMHIKPQLSQPFVTQLVQEGFNSPDLATRDSAGWTGSLLQHLMQQPSSS